MTESTTIDRALRATGVLRACNESGVLDAADVHVMTRVARLAGGDTAEPALFAGAMAVRALRHGSVCVPLGSLRREALVLDPELTLPSDVEIRAALDASPLVRGSDAGPVRPLRLVDAGGETLLYLEKYFQQEERLRALLDDRAASRPMVDAALLAARLDALFPTDAVDARSGARQKVAAAVALTSWTSAIVGGPGTGKTHTVARIIALLRDQLGDRLRLHLAAPTGRAAARLAESVNGQADELGIPRVEATTIHRMLGPIRGSLSTFRHHAGNPLPHNVVIVDETSMVSLTTMASLLDAVRPDARLILVGDPDQLASVDAGVVLADIVARPVGGAGVVPPPSSEVEAVLAEASAADYSPAESTEVRAGIARLLGSRRFDAGLAALAEAVRAGDPEAVTAAVDAGGAITRHDDVDSSTLRATVLTTHRSLIAAARVGDAESALDALRGHRILCAHREGPYGAAWWSRQVVIWLAEEGLRAAAGRFYPGQPILVEANDPAAGVYNGDIGVVVDAGADDSAGGRRLLVAIDRGVKPLLISPYRIAEFSTVYAMTIHRSQGSQYRDVTVILPPEDSPLHTRELVYTAVTRAQRSVELVGTARSLELGVTQHVQRASGLRYR